MKQPKRPSRSKDKQKANRGRLALGLFLASLGLLIFGYGFAVGKFQIFPYRFLELAAKGSAELRERTPLQLPFYYVRVEGLKGSSVRNTPQAYQGLNLVTRVGADRMLYAEIIDMDGRKLHAWKIDWFTIWPDARHLPSQFVPRSRPGTHIHLSLIHI